MSRIILIIMEESETDLTGSKMTVIPDAAPVITQPANPKEKLIA
jgi:hypothetical protein